MQPLKLKETNQGDLMNTTTMAPPRAPRRDPIEVHEEQPVEKRGIFALVLDFLGGGVAVEEELDGEEYRFILPK